MDSILEIKTTDSEQPITPSAVVPCQSAWGLPEVAPQGSLQDLAYSGTEQNELGSRAPGWLSLMDRCEAFLLRHGMH